MPWWTASSWYSKGRDWHRSLGKSFWNIVLSSQHFHEWNVNLIEEEQSFVLLNIRVENTAIGTLDPGQYRCFDNWAGFGTFLHLSHFVFHINADIEGLGLKYWVLAKQLISVKHSTKGGKNGWLHYFHNIFKIGSIINLFTCCILHSPKNPALSCRQKRQPGLNLCVQILKSKNIEVQLYWNAISGCVANLANVVDIIDPSHCFPHSWGGAVLLENTNFKSWLDRVDHGRME